MPNIKEEDFDNLIRKIVEGQPIKFEPDHWQKMEQKLAMAEAKETYNRNIRTSTLILSLLWSMVMLWLYLSHDIRSKENDQNKAVIASNEKQEVIQRGSVTNYPGERSVPLNTIPAPQQARESVLLPAGPENISNVIKPGPEGIAAQEPKALSKITGQTAGDGLSGGKKLPYVNTAAVIRAVSVTRSSQVAADGLNGSYTTRYTTIGRLERMPADIAHPSYVSGLDLSFKEIEWLAPKKVKENDKDRVSGLYVSLNAAANLSSVGFSKMAPPGFDWGITFEYFLGKKVSLVSGALYSTKRYSMDEGYQSGSNNSYYDKTINQVDGRCAVLDIPLNLRYYFISSKKHLFFLSSGMSSYLMLNEAYDLYTEDYYGEVTKRTKKLSNENKHIFGIVNFSFGYERVLSEHISLQVAPFVKMPITDIGDYKIGLNSAGAFLSFKYRLR